jgi:two-component system sensor histidine kinase GlrK
MATLLPQSFHRLILIGFVLMALPLVLAVVLAYQLSERVVVARQEVLARAVLAGQVGRQIEDALGAMKQQLMLLPPQAVPEVAALPAFQRLNQDFIERFNYFATLSTAVGQEAAIKRVVERARILGEDFRARGDVSLLAGQLYRIDDETRAILHAGDRVVEQEIGQLGGRVATLRLILLATVPLALFVAAVVLVLVRSVVVGRIRAMDRTLREIGRADFVPDIAVVGKPDFPDLARRLDWLQRRLRNLESQRTRFLRHISHDLKTPLTAICEGAQLLSEGAAGPLDPRQRPLVDIVNKNARRLQKFIEDLLNYQEVSSARVSLELRPIRMSQLCETVLGAHIIAAGKHNIRIKRNLADGELNGDWNKLYAVLDNLISNAIKFSPEDGVVTVSLADEGDEMVLDVVDQGSGVPEEERKRVFEPFFRGTRARKGAIKGSGLGLAIARDYARAHRGRLELLDSAQGAHFRLTLPKRQGSARTTD